MNLQLTDKSQRDSQLSHVSLVTPLPVIKPEIHLVFFIKGEFTYSLPKLFIYLLS